VRRSVSSQWSIVSQIDCTCLFLPTTGNGPRTRDHGRATPHASPPALHSLRPTAHPPRLILSCIIFACFLSAARGDEAERVTVLGEAPRTARLIAEADRLAAEKRWPEAVNEYLNLLRESGDDLVRLTPDHFLAARRVCDLRLASLPLEALAIYRRAVEGRAEKLMAQGMLERPMLAQVVEEAFCTRAAAKALDRLGDLAFERGEFDEAQQWWSTLALPASTPKEGFMLVHPDSGLEPAYLRAKLILARIFQGDRASAETELRQFAALHESARGHLAGRDGVYTAILRDLLSDADALRLPPLPERWSTFGGNAARNFVPQARGRLSRFPQLNGSEWTVRLHSEEKSEFEAGYGFDSVPGRALDDSRSSQHGLPLSQAARSLACYPVIADDLILTADSRYVTAYQLHSGRTAWRYDVATNHQAEHRIFEDQIPTKQDACFSLSVWGDSVYVRLGAEPVAQSSRPWDRGWAGHSYLVRLKLHAASSSDPERWSILARGKRKPRDDGREPRERAREMPEVNRFEGPPVVDRGRVYVVETRVAGGLVRTSIVCYDADRGHESWRQEVCETAELSVGSGHAPARLLALAGDHIVYANHWGAVIALETRTGRRAWAVRYRAHRPSRGEAEFAKDEAVYPSAPFAPPCLYADGRIFVAPQDLDCILCLDAATGTLQWESAAVDCVHLLGAIGGRLIFTATTPWPCVRAFDVGKGLPVPQWVQPREHEELALFGHGLLAGDKVFWPTSRGLHVLRQENGEPIAFDPRIRGNLAGADGCLVVAGVESLTAYLPEKRRKQ
jgi:cellulose synthase operon protein C